VELLSSFTSFSQIVILQRTTKLKTPANHAKTIASISMQVSDSSRKTWSTKDICDWTKNKHLIQYHSDINLKQDKNIKQHKTGKTLLIRYNKITKTHLMKIQIQTTPPPPGRKQMSYNCHQRKHQPTNSVCYDFSSIHSFQHQNSTKL